MDITVYTVEDAEGQTIDGFETYDYEEAKATASAEKGMVIANEYEFSDSYMVDDYREHPDRRRA